MKNILASFLTVSALVSFARVSQAAPMLYNCVDTKGLQATLVIGSTTKEVTWMPADGAQTSKANVDNPRVDAGSFDGLSHGGFLEYPLFGFQDQEDYLDVPADALSGVKQIPVRTFRDDDDYTAPDQIEHFTCKLQ